jgi:hypothetical protein
MATIVTPVYWGVGILCAGAFLVRGLTAWDDRRCRRASGYLFWAATAIGLAATAWFATEEASVLARNITLGLIGAAIGSAGLIWVGYATHDAMAQQPLDSSTPAPPPPAPPPSAGSGPTINFSGTNSGIVSTGNNNTVNVNNDPRLWGFKQDQAQRFRDALASSNAHGTIYLRINDILSRNLRDQLITLISSVPRWKTLYQGERSQSEVHGLVIYMRDANNPSPVAKAVVDALAASGFFPNAPRESLPSWTDDDVRIEIGSPP